MKDPATLRWSREPGDPPWLAEAWSWVGTKEAPGKKNNPTIIGWLRKFADNIGNWGKGRDSTAWCAVFVSKCLAAAGIDGTNHALARSYATWGRPSKLNRGSIIVIQRKIKGEDRTTGSRAGYHVGFLLAVRKYHYVILGGNQSNEVRVTYFPKSRYNVVAVRAPVP